MKLASIMPLWYVLFWAGLTAAVCAFCLCVTIVVCVLGWFAGPHIVARGLKMWVKTRL